jgi:hypothetical protein
MGKTLDRVISWFLSALTIIILGALSILGWYNYFFGGIFFVIGVVLAFFSVRSLVKAMRGGVAVTDSSGSPLTSRKQTAICIMFLLVAIVFLTLGILAIAGYIDLTNSADADITLARVWKIAQP